MLSAVVDFRVARQQRVMGLPIRYQISVAAAPGHDVCAMHRKHHKEITMPHNRPSTCPKPQLDDLLAMIGLTREQLREMTADDLFAAAVEYVGSPIDHLEYGLHRPATGLPRLD
jgi:hypothetical protein